jgi:hypothetical protein
MNNNKAAQNKTSPLQIIFIFLFIAGLLAMVAFFIVEFASGKQIYESSPIEINSQVEFNDTVSLSPENNPLRLMRNINYAQSNINCYSSCKIYDYELTIKKGDTTIFQDSGHATYDDDEDAPTSSTSVIGDFEVDEASQYQLNFTATPTQDLSGTVKTTIKIRANTLSLPISILIGGFITSFSAAIGLFLSVKRGHNDNIEPVSENINPQRLGEPILIIKNKITFNVGTILSLFFITLFPGGFLLVIALLILTFAKIPDPFSTVLISGLPLFGVISLVGALILNLKNSYVKIFNKYIHIYNEKRNLIFLKPKFDDVYKKINDITHISHKQKNQLEIVFSDNYRATMTHPKLESEYKEQIIRICSQDQHQFSILDGQGLHYSQPFPSDFFFASPNQNLRSIIMEFRTGYTYNIKDNLGNIIAVLEKDGYDNITKEYRLKDPQTDHVILKGTYLATKAGNILKLQSRVKAFGVYNGEGMMLALGYMDEKLLPTSSDFDITIGTEKIEYKSKGLVNETGTIRHPLIPDIQFTIKKLNKSVVNIDTPTGAPLPLRFSLILTLILYADIDYTGNEDDD